VKFLAINRDLVKGGDYVNIYSFGGDLVNYLGKIHKYIENNLKRKKPMKKTYKLVVLLFFY
jgi:hypothetical protein